MQILEEILKRCSVRSYESRPVPPEALRRIMEAARLAPSARNVQEWRFVIVTDIETRRSLVPAAAMQEFVAQAPVVIAVSLPAAVALPRRTPSANNSTNAPGVVPPTTKVSADAADPLLRRVRLSSNETPVSEPSVRSIPPGADEIDRG